MTGEGMGGHGKALEHLTKGSCNSGQTQVDSKEEKGDGCKLVLRHDT